MFKSQYREVKGSFLNMQNREARGIIEIFSFRVGM